MWMFQTCVRGMVGPSRKKLLIVGLRDVADQNTCHGTSDRVARYFVCRKGVEEGKK